MTQSFWQGFRSLRQKFRQDTHGGVAVIFAAAGITLCLLVAGGIEMHRRSLALALLQKATDTAALAAKRHEADSRGSLTAAAARAKGEAEGRSMFDLAVREEGRIFGVNLPVPTFTWLESGAVRVDVAGRVELIFSGFLPGDFNRVDTHSVVDVGVPLPTELALVLDNTSSMFQKDGRPQTRFTQLRDAAKTFTHTLFDAAQQANVDFLRMSVVPWTTTVNVRGEAPRVADYSGKTGIASIADRGSQLQVANPVDRSGRVNVNAATFGDIGWRGCISGSGEAQNPSDAGGMSWNALGVPSPVLSQSWIGFGDVKPVQYQDCKWTCRDDGNTNCGGGGGGGNPGGGTQGFYDLLRRTVPQVAPARIFGDRLKQAVDSDVQNACQTCSSSDCVTKTRDQLVCDTYERQISCWQDIAMGRRNPYVDRPAVCASDACLTRGSNYPKISIGPCVGDPNEPGIKSGALKWCPWVAQTNWTQQDPITGPNINCPTPMLGLSGNRRQVLETLDRMTPVPGGTHADVGLRWGLRTMSPNGAWPEFFGLTKPPAAFRGQERKIMVLITDGENQQAIDYPGYWGCSSTSNPGCSTSPDKARLDQMMLAWCSDIRSRYQVELFAIAVNFSNPQAVALLRQCAPEPQHFFNIDAAQLKNVLNIIASSVIRLRITS